MKKITKIVSIILFCAISGLSNVSNAQNIQAYSDATIVGGGFSYNVQLSITPLENNDVTHSGGWIVKIISVNSDSKGYYSKGKTNRYYSCSELGSICNPSKFDMVTVKVKYQCDNIGEKSVVFYGIDREERIVVRQKPNTNCSIEFESVRVVGYDNGLVYRKRINEIEYPQQNTTTNNSAAPSSNTGNPAMQKGSSSEVYINGQGATKSTSTGNTTQTTKTNVTETKATPVQKPDSYKGNPMTYNTNSGSNTNNSSNNVYKEASNALGSALTQWGDQMQVENEARAQRQREEAEKLAQKNSLIAKENQEKGERYFKRQLDQYLIAAENGDENSRMRLYLEMQQVGRLWKYDISYKLPNADKWLIEAAKNKNNFAMDMIGSQVIYMKAFAEAGYPTGAEKYGMDYNQGLILLKESANMGSLDAMMTLANFYNRKGKYYGSNAEIAFNYYSEAAKKGSPNAMYYLGRIYRDKEISNIKYNHISKDNAIAFRWFLKSAASIEFQETMFGELGVEGGSSFERSVYDELSTMYEKGLGIKADKEIAEKLKRAYYDYDYKYATRKSIYDQYLASANVDRWGDNPQDNAINPPKTDNSNSTNNAFNLLKSVNTSSANNTKTSTITPKVETSTLNEKAEYEKAKNDYKAGTISKEAYKEAIKKYGDFAAFESKRLQKAYQNKEITYSEYNQAIKILLRR